MKKQNVIITVIFVVGLLVGFFFVTSLDIDVSVEQPTATAQSELPKGVEKFTDGYITCYTFDEYNAFRSADTSSGISCVKN